MNTRYDYIPHRSFARRSRRRLVRSAALVVAALFAFGILTYLFSAGWRTAQIEECNARGGQAITHSVFSDRYYDVDCIEARR